MASILSSQIPLWGIYIYITGASPKQSKSEIERKINYYAKSAMWIRNRIITKNYWDCIYAG